MNPSARAMESLDRYRSLERVPELTAKLEGGLKYKAYPHGEEIHYAPEPRVCHVIVTFRSVLWTLMTILATFVVAVSVSTPHWLVGKHRWVGITSHHRNGSGFELGERTYRPTIGIFNQCNRAGQTDFDSEDLCATFVTDLNVKGSEFPPVWKVALCFYTLGLVLLSLTVFLAVASFSIQTVFRKSIFSLTGSIQSISGLFLVTGLILYPAGWGAQAVRNLCGNHAQAFLLDHCTLGWAFYTMVLGTLLVFISAVFSMKAEEATSSDKVESKVLDGKHIICII